MTAASLPNLGRDEKVTHPDSRLVTYQKVYCKRFGLHTRARMPDSSNPPSSDAQLPSLAAAWSHTRRPP